MGKLSIFQMGVIGFFVLAAIAGVVAFGGLGAGGDSDSIVEVTAWGTVPNVAISAATKVFKSSETVKILYVEKDPRTIESELVEALASGRGPDMVILPHDMLYGQMDRLFLIPYSSYDERRFRDTFVQEGELYLFQKGIAALPLYIDPLLMFWNKDIFSEKGEALPPASWDDFINLTKLINVKDERLNITRSAIALGEYGNITNSKAILSAMFLQAGMPVVAKTSGTPVPAILGSAVNGVRPGEAVLNFYSQFANPVGAVYSWNRALPQDRLFFLSSNLAVYLGFASEVSYLRERNPHLNFDITGLPRPRQSSNVVTFGKMYGVSVLKSSAKINGAIAAAGILTRSDVVKAASAAAGIAPARKDLLAAPAPDKPNESVFFTAAIQSRGWLDPSQSLTDTVFQKMVEEVISGKKKSREAISAAEADILEIIKKNKAFNTE